MAASESVIQIIDAAAATKYLHTSSRSYGGTTKEDQFWLPAQPVRTTYRGYAGAISSATSASHIGFIQADGTNYTFITGFWLPQTTLAGSASTANIQVIRTSTAGTGGTTISAYPVDAGDTSPYGGTLMTLPTGKGTEGVTLLGGPVGMVAAQPMNYLNQWWYRFGFDEKPIVIGTATTDGVCWKIVTGIASGKFDWMVEFYTAAQK